MVGIELSLPTDSEDEKAVEEVLSQAVDESVLEQIAAINCCSSFDNHPLLTLKTTSENLKHSDQLIFSQGGVLDVYGVLPRRKRENRGILIRLIFSGRFLLENRIRQ